MKTPLVISGLILMIAIASFSCKKTSGTDESVAKYSSEPVLPAYTENYEVSANDNLATLGRVLFYDKNLSLNNSVACGSCHEQSKAFCDNMQFSTGLENMKTPRNSPSIFAKQGRLFWDGRASSFTDLVLRPIQNHIEMGITDMKALSDKIGKTDYYKPLFEKAFNGNSTVDESKIRTALTEFLRNFNFSKNKFSASAQGQSKLSASEELGKDLFFGRAQCANCHHIEGGFGTANPGGYGFTDESHNIGLDAVTRDQGVGGISGTSSQAGAFMVPVLLNVEFTGPYMHDGRFKTLEEVVEHYNSGVKNHPNLDPQLRDIGGLEQMTETELLLKFDKNGNGVIEDNEVSSIPPRRLGLSAAEKRGLVDFLKTLSDPAIFQDKRFSNPFVSK